MNARSVTTSSKDVPATRQEVRGPEIGPALKRDRILQRVQAARKRLTPTSDRLARLR
jgi:hypothetical protein